MARQGEIKIRVATRPGRQQIDAGAIAQVAQGTGVRLDPRRGADPVRDGTIREVEVGGAPVQVVAQGTGATSYLGRTSGGRNRSWSSADAPER